jgi:hypothetical protein
VLTESIEAGSPLAALLPVTSETASAPAVPTDSPTPTDAPAATDAPALSEAAAPTDAPLPTADTDSPVAATPSNAPAPTQPAAPTGPTLTPLPPATLPPQGDFATWWAEDAALQQSLGLARIERPVSLQVVSQPFEQGLMVWRSDDRRIYALFADGTWASYPDSFREGELERDPNIYTPGELLQPVRGFGRLWRSDNALQERIGWATREEEPSLASVQFFDSGAILRVGTRAYALIEGASGNEWVERP